MSQALVDSDTLDAHDLRVGSGDRLPRGAERRTEPRFTPADLRHRLAARYKYGEPVTLVDLSVGGVQFETPQLVRPDTEIELEIIDSRTREISQVVSRVLRANVSAVTGGRIRYRAACAFKRPLSHPTLLVPAETLARPNNDDHAKFEIELKTIVDNFVKRVRGAGGSDRPDAASLVDALVHLRFSAQRRRDPIDRQLGVLLEAMIPALQRREPTDVVLRTVQELLAARLPLRAIRTNNAGPLAHDCERLTLSTSVDPNAPPTAITAEFPLGFGLDASQFRLLKAGAYLVGLIDSWHTHVVPEAPPPTTAAPEAPAEPEELPFGWHRVVLRYTDGQLLHGYSNDFSPDRACLQLSPSMGCPLGERLLVPIAHLKAVFFVKTLHGDRHRVDVHVFDHVPRGRKVQVTFRDAEVLIGSTLSYKPNEQGFFVLPANSGSNNIRIYVVTAAIRHFRFL